MKSSRSLGGSTLVGTGKGPGRRERASLPRPVGPALNRHPGRTTLRCSRCRRNRHRPASWALRRTDSPGRQFSVGHKVSRYPLKDRIRTMDAAFPPFPLEFPSIGSSPPASRSGHLFLHFIIKSVLAPKQLKSDRARGAVQARPTRCPTSDTVQTPSPSMRP